MKTITLAQKKGTVGKNLSCLNLGKTCSVAKNLSCLNINTFSYIKITSCYMEIWYSYMEILVKRIQPSGAKPSNHIAELFQLNYISKQYFFNIFI